MLKMIPFMLLLLLASCTVIYDPKPKSVDAGADHALDVESGDELILEVTDSVDSLEITDIDFETSTGCGNGEIDDGEECDDGRNGNADDGCTDDCSFSCHSSYDCDDGDICNGDEICDVDHTCQAGADAVAGTECDDGEHCTDPDECNGSGFCIGTEKEYLFGVARISSGGRHNCALLVNGIAMCWGDNEHGQLGNGVTVLSNIPVNVSVVESEILAISPAFYHTCVLLTDASVQCWGGNMNGQLGDGTTDDSLVPVPVEGLSSGVTSVIAWSLHSCALLSGGELKCWGQNTRGQLGDGTMIDRLSPIGVIGISESISSFSLGDSHTCALTAVGSVQCWGANGHGQLGNGTTDDSSTPVEVIGLSAGVTAITSRVRHTCALLNSGQVQCWGDNQYGQLGDGTTEDRTSPVDVTGLTSNVSKVVAGGTHTCAILDNGGLMCWGLNSMGQCGDGTTDLRITPANVTGLASGVVDISLSYMNSCALLDWGTVKCWGRNDFGEVGDGTNAERWSPVDVLCR